MDREYLHKICDDTINHYLGYLGHRLNSNSSIGTGWYRDLSRSDRVGNVASSQIILTYSLLKESIPEAESVFETLAKRQLNDGGWPFISNIDHVGVVDSTSWVLLALLSQDSTISKYSENIQKAVEWLRDAQNTDGGWGLIKGSKSRVGSTSIALRALCKLENHELQPVIVNGAHFLTDKQNPDYSWNNYLNRPCVGSTAHAIISLAECSCLSLGLFVKRGLTWLINNCCLANGSLWDKLNACEEIDIIVDGKIVRFFYSFPVTPLAIRALLTHETYDDKIENICTIFLNKIYQGEKLAGTFTAEGNDCSYGVHDIIFSVYYAKKFLTPIPPTPTTNCLEEVKNDITNSELPRLFEITRSTISSPANKLKIVFIHGLCGDPVDTWRHEDTDTYLPCILSEKIPQAEVYSLGYPNSFSYWKGNAMSLEHRSRSIIQIFENNHLESGRVVLIGHSFGGLLIKNILVGIHTEELDSARVKKLLSSILGVVFIATPHQGSCLANFATSLKTIFRTTPAVGDLQWNKENLKLLNKRYKAIAANLGISHLSFYETLKTRKVQVVNSDSADLGIPGARIVPIDANHIDICKPRTLNSPILDSLVNFIKDLLV